MTEHVEFDVVTVPGPVEGITLRDFFAGCLAGYVFGDEERTRHNTDIELGALAYRLADAMLAARGPAPGEADPCPYCREFEERPPADIDKVFLDPHCCQYYAHEVRDGEQVKVSWPRPYERMGEWTCPECIRRHRKIAANRAAVRARREKHPLSGNLDAMKGVPTMPKSGCGEWNGRLASYVPIDTLRLLSTEPWFKTSAPAVVEWVEDNVPADLAARKEPDPTTTFPADFDLTPCVATKRSGEGMHNHEAEADCPYCRELEKRPPEAYLRLSTEANEYYTITVVNSRRIRTAWPGPLGPMAEWKCRSCRDRHAGIVKRKYRIGDVGLETH